MLPEVQGPFYALDKAQLFQRGLPGCGQQLNCAIYHVQVDKLRILDPGNGEPSTPPVPTIARTPFPPFNTVSEESTGRCDAAFDSFGTKSSSPSPNQKIQAPVVNYSIIPPTH
ncbi:hypothetical protein B0H14DRAFT_3904253 [Mycena olivaceomarginata]|nr:hypothetical protein B0H14DRAFT_3904253 [Mycena olivaceomarginata]